MPGLPAGMTPHQFLMWWRGPARGFQPGAITNLSNRARVLAKLVPKSVLQHLSTFQRSRLVLLVEKIGEYGGTAAQRALRPSERRALLNISKGINRIVASGRTAAAERAILSRGAQVIIREFGRVNLRRAASRGVLGTLGVGGTVLVGSLLAILAVGLYANARQASVMERIRAENAAGGDPAVLVVGLPPEDLCVVDEAAARGLIWSEPDGEPSGLSCTAADCGWQAPMQEPNWTAYPNWPGLEGPALEAKRAEWLEAKRAEWADELPRIVQQPLAEAREACGFESVVAGEPAASAWPVPTSEELCDFLPGWIPRTGQSAISVFFDDPQCVGAESADGYTPIWAEVVVPFGQTAVDADDWLSLVPDQTNFVRGNRIDLEIGDRSWRFENEDNHAVGGIIGPIGYLMTANTTQGRAADLEASAVHIVNAYLEWADQQG